MPATFKIYSSSAGSGKTYQLTKEYLKLALHTEDPQYYRNILAITFTNDAAKEMKERIISSLRQFNDPTLPEREKAKSEQLLEAITAEIKAEYPDRNLNQDQLRTRAGRMFQHLLYHYSEFAVSTIDSFVNKVVSAFTRELDIPYNFEVDLESNTLLATAVSLLLDKATRQKTEALLTHTLETYALEKAQEGRNWNRLPEELADFGRHLLNEQRHEAIQSFSKLSLTDFKKIRKDLYELRQAIEMAAHAPAQAAVALVAQAGLAPEDLFYGKTGIYGYFLKYTREFDPDYAPSRARTTVEEDKWAGAKANAAVKVKLDSVKQMLGNYYRQIEEVKERDADTYKLAAAMLPHLYKISVLNELEKCIQEIKQDRNLVHISEFNKRITDIVLKEPVPFIYERLGEKYNHILIDEFQDTSVLQWNNLLPLVDNALGTGNFNMLVGDAKQAIYRWRGGEMEQILHLHKRQTHRLYPQGPDRDLVRDRYAGINHSLQPANLNTNYRSAREIIEFNNGLFGFISQALPQFPLLQSIYDEGFRQESPPTGRTGGHVQLLFTQEEASCHRLDLDTGEPTDTCYEGYEEGRLLSYRESMLLLVLELVHKAQAEGYQLKDLAVLNRFNKDSRATAAFLKERGFDIISQDSLSLQFAEVVNLIIAMFRVFDRPADTLARAEALYLFCKVVLQQVPDNDLTQAIARISQEKGSSTFFAFISEHDPRYELDYEQTGNLSLYELTEKLIRVFDLLGKNNECEYLFRFLDVVLEYSLKHSNNLHNFLEYWEGQKEKLTINTPQNRNAITITSIHKAKGLAYPVLIVPFADWPMEPRPSELLWARLPENLQPRFGMERAVVAMTKKMESGALADQYRFEVEKTFIDNLNMLYVALTRPMDRLYLIGHRKDFSKDSNAKSISYWLFRYLQHLDMWADDRASYILAAGGPAIQRSTQGPETFVLDKLTSSDWAQRLQLRQHANNIFDFETQREHRQLHRKLQYALSRLDSASHLEAVLRQLINEGIISQRERAELETQLQQIIGHPQLAPYFREHAVFEQGREILDVRATRYKPDRLIFETTPETRVTLLDFRSPPEVPEHRDNLNHYARLIQNLGTLHVTCCIYYFEEERVEQWEPAAPVVADSTGDGG